MKKTTKKVVSLLTILSFLLTLAPVAAFAAPADATFTVTSNPTELVEGTAATLTVTLENNAKFVAGDKVTVTNGSGELVTEVDAPADGTTVDVPLTSDKVKAGEYTVSVTGATAERTVTIKAESVNRGQSYIDVDDDKIDAYVDGSNGQKSDVDVILRAFNGSAPKTVAGTVYVWADNGTDALMVEELEKDTVIPNVWSKHVTNDVTSFKVGFNVDDKTYTLHAAYVPDTANPELKKISDLREFEIGNPADIDSQKIRVSATDSDIKSLKIEIKKGGKWEPFIPKVSLADKDKEFKEAYKLFVNANGLTATKIRVSAYKDENQTIPADRGTLITFETSGNLLVENGSEAVVKNGSKGAEVELTSSVDGTSKLYISVDDFNITLSNVEVQSQKAAFIELIKSPAKGLAWDNDFKNKAKGMKSFVRFQIKDINGNVMKDKIAGEDVFATGDPGEYVKVLDKPAASRVEDDDFYLLPVKENGEIKDYYTLVSEKELTEGKYTVQVALNNGKKAQVSFEIAKFGTAKELKLEYDTETVELNADVKSPSVTFVDENGVEKDAVNRVTLGYNGYAVANDDNGKTTFVKEGSDKGAFKVKDDEKYLGSKITVTAVAEREGLTAKADLTVAQDGRGIKFASDKGVVGANNRVSFQLVDGDGKTVALGSKYDTSAIVVESQSDADAKISASVTSTGDLQEKGVGELSLTSDKRTTADIAVYVRGENGKYYAGNLKYTFGDKPSYADRTVVMTIGSNQVIVDNNIVTIDTAALIKNSRTFVPFRALAEAFGAEVEWDKDKQAVTAKMDGKTVVMTVGSKDYKVGDKEAQMDVEPYINAENRTMIPVRFAAEALGFKVTPTYNADGTTASVAFNK